MPKINPVFSPSEENYLKAIYHLQRQKNKVSTNQVAEKVQTKPASVTDMLKKLKAKELIDYTPYHGVSLTKPGMKTALEIIRRHRLWEYFLVNSIGFQWDEVHEIAEQLEHIRHPHLIDKLDAFLGYPKFDPHGDPIPDKDGKMALTEYRKLSDLAVGGEVVFKSVGLQTPELMQVLTQKKMELGDRLKIIQKYDFDHSLDVMVNNNILVSLSLRLASNVLVL